MYAFTVTGRIIKNLPGESYEIETTAGSIITATLDAGFYDGNYNLLVGDKVTVRMNSSNLESGIITQIWIEPNR